MLIYIFWLLWSNENSQDIATITNYTLEGHCPDVKLQENFDYTRFSGLWYNVASLASDNRTLTDCATLELQEDDHGYTLKETFINQESPPDNLTLKTYPARVDPTFDAGNKAKFIVSYELSSRTAPLLQFPFYILTTDYDNFAIAYTCKNKQRNEGKHYVFIWILMRTKDKLDGDKLKRVENTLSKYTELVGNRSSFVFRVFDESNCTFYMNPDAYSFPGNI